MSEPPTPDPAPEPEEDWLRFGVAALLSKTYAADQRHFLQCLAELLEPALPGRVEVERKGGLFARVKPVREVRVLLGDFRYALRDPGHGPLVGARTLIKHGIALRTEELSLDAWFAAFGDAMDDYARDHETAAGALRKFLGR
jgi:hypothetical protein